MWIGLLEERLIVYTIYSITLAQGGAHLIGDITMITIDFETDKIVNGSSRTPRPVGLSVKHDNESAEYFAWGHTSGNNIDVSTAKDILIAIFDSNQPILAHHAKFDIRICMEHFNLPFPDPSRVNDTMIMAYLHDPREQSFALKYLADRYLNIPPDEQQELKQYILRHIPKATEKTWGEYISQAPGNIVGKYADGDTTRTYLLYQYLLPYIQEKRV